MSTPVTPELIASLWSPSDPQVSPDGRRLAWTAAPHGTEGEHREESIWVADIAGAEPGRRWTRGAEDTSPRWSPDGTRLAFLSDRAERGTPGLHVIDAAGGESRPLVTRRRAVGGFAWSPDGAGLAFLAPDEPTEEDERREKERDDAQVWGEEWHRQRLWLRARRRRPARAPVGTRPAPDRPGVVTRRRADRAARATRPAHAVRDRRAGLGVHGRRGRRPPGVPGRRRLDHRLVGRPGRARRLPRGRAAVQRHGLGRAGRWRGAAGRGHRPRRAAVHGRRRARGRRHAHPADRRRRPRHPAGVGRRRHRTTHHGPRGDRRHRRLRLRDRTRRRRPRGRGRRRTSHGSRRRRAARRAALRLRPPRPARRGRPGPRRAARVRGRRRHPARRGRAPPGRCRRTGALADGGHRARRSLRSLGAELEHPPRALGAAARPARLRRGHAQLPRRASVAATTSRPRPAGRWARSSGTT